VNQLIITVLFWTAIAFVVGAIAFIYFKQVEHLSDEEALRRAIKIGYEVWQVSDFTAPGSLMQAQVAGKLLREAGLVLKAEIVGDSTNGHAMSEAAARPHPELVRVSPVELALGVQKMVLGGLKF
jgi:hypothetical protein